MIRSSLAASSRVTGKSRLLPYPRWHAGRGRARHRATALPQKEATSLSGAIPPTKWIKTETSTSKTWLLNTAMAVFTRQFQKASAVPIADAIRGGLPKKNTHFWTE
jgi:hypothetical protein